jgi:radical SAM superfamily enzyme YgiQ (UPF0313 family)
VQAYLAGQENESLAEILNESSPFDYAIAGEGEEVFPRLISSLIKGEEIRAKDGVNFFREGAILCGGLAPRIKDLGAFAWPSWKGLKVGRYRDMRTKKLDLSVHFNRGCRRNCTFCSTGCVYGRGVRTTPAEEAAAYLKWVVENFRPPVITFTDEDFFANMRWVEELVGLLEADNLHKQFGVEFDTFASIPDLHLLERDGRGRLLDRMKEVGFSSFTIGIESFNAEVLLRYDKENMILVTMSREERNVYEELDSEQKKRMLVAHHYQTAQEAINFASEHGLLVVGDYMIGGPGEDETEVRTGFKLFSELGNLLVAYIPILTAFPGAPLWREAYRSWCLPRTIQGGVDWAQFNVSSGELESLRNDLELQFYTSKRYRRDMIKTLEKNPPFRSFFLGRFNYLDGLFPGDDRVQEMLSLLYNT